MLEDDCLRQGWARAGRVQGCERTKGRDAHVWRAWAKLNFRIPCHTSSAMKSRQRIAMYALDILRSAQHIVAFGMRPMAACKRSRRGVGRIVYIAGRLTN